MARKITGVVVSSAGNKTITVRISRAKSHPLYRKQYVVNKNFHAHDEKNEAHVGDRVEIEECAPISKSKKWKLVSIVEKSIEDLEPTT
jgi:small subunit ribosomal protein S17